jgi:hypothetical protein
MKDNFIAFAVFVLAVLSFYMIGCAWKEATEPNIQLCPLCNK